MIFEPLKIRRPFDPTGENRDNYVHSEIHTLPPLARRIIVPRMGAFYAKSLVVRQGGETLKLGEDYELAALYHDATVEVGQDVNVLIVFTNEKIIGDVELDYQVVGGDFTGTFEMIQQYVNVLLVDPRKVRWDDILAKPDFYAPREHFHDIHDVYGLNAIVPILEQMRQALIRIRSKEFRQVYDRIVAIKGQVDDNIRRVISRVDELDERTGGSGSNIDNIKERLRDALARIATLEQSSAVADLSRSIQTELQQLRSQLEGFTNQKADKTKVDEQYNTLMSKITGYFTNAGKLKNEHLPISSIEGNRLEVLPDGLAVKPVVDLLKNSEEYIQYYIDAVNGSDTYTGTNGRPFRSITYAISKLLPGLSYQLNLRPNQTHMVSYNETAILNNVSVLITTWSTGNNADKARIQLGRDDRTPEPYGDRRLSQCIEINNSLLEFSHVHLIIKSVISTNIQNVLKPVIGYGGKNYVSYRSIILGRNVSIDLPLKIDSIFSTVYSGNTNVVMDTNLFDVNRLSGEGKIFGILDNTTTVLFRSNQNTDDLTFKPNNQQLGNIIKYIPQLKRTILGVYGEINTNIDYTLLPFEKSENTGISNIRGNKLSIAKDGLYLGANDPKTGELYGIYVDALAGSDTANDGTFEKPYRTINAALKQLMYGVSAYILLKERQQHIIEYSHLTNDGIEVLAKQVTFQPYGLDTTTNAIQVYDESGKFRTSGDKAGTLIPGFNTSERQGLNISKLDTTIKFVASPSKNVGLFTGSKLYPNQNIEFNFSQIRFDLISGNNNNRVSILNPNGNSFFAKFYGCTFKGNIENTTIIDTDNASSNNTLVIEQSQYDTRPMLEDSFQFATGGLEGLQIDFLNGALTYANRREILRDKFKALKVTVLNWNNGFVSNIPPTLENTSLTEEELRKIVSPDVGNMLSVRDGKLFVTPANIDTTQLVTRSEFRIGIDSRMAITVAEEEFKKLKTLIESQAAEIAQLKLRVDQLRP